MMYAADFRAKAREALQGNWGVAVGTGFVAGLLGVSSSVSSGTGVSFDLSDIETISGYMESGEAKALLYAIVGGSVIFAVLISLFHLIVGGAATLGYTKFNLNMVDKNEEAQFNNLFSQFHRLGTGIAMRLLLGIYTFLWSLLFIIPGIVKGFSYAMTPYIMVENPSMSANEAITESRKLMDGNKWRLFCLNISFIGWAYLCVFSCGIGYFWLYPYQEAALAAFYREIKREKYGEAEVEEPTTDVPGVAMQTEGTDSYEAMLENRYREPEYRDMSYYETNQEKNENTDEN